MHLILHIGQQKTGSTSLQSFFRQNRKKLINNGILYPKPWKGNSHSHIVTSIFEYNRWPRLLKDLYQNKPYEIERGAEFIFNQIYICNKNKITKVIISTEYLFRELSGYNILKLNQYLLQYFNQTSVVCFIRKPSDHYLSDCFQKIKHSSKIKKPIAANIKNVISSYEKIGTVIPLKYNAKYNVEDKFIEVCNINEKNLIKSKESENISISSEAAAILQKYRSIKYPEYDDMNIQNVNKLRKILVQIIKENDLQNNVELNEIIKMYIDYGCNDLFWLHDKYDISFDDINYKLIGSPPEITLPRLVEDICYIDEEIKEKLLYEIIDRLLRNEVNS